MLGTGCVDNANAPRIPDNPHENTPAVLVATPKSSESSAPPPKWYYAAGPHSDGGLSQNKNYAIDISPPVVKSCPGSEPLTDYPFPSPMEGKVVIVGNDKDPKDPNHSVVVVENKNGIRIGMMHLANIKVRLGQEVKSGDLIGDPSCEVIPDGGSTTGIHVHVFMTAKGSSGVNPDFGKAIPVDEVEFVQGVFRGTSREHGTLEKPGEKTLTADKRRCDTDDKCGGIRNDLNGFLQILTQVKNKLNVNLRYADGSPVFNSGLDIYRQSPDINGNPTINSEKIGESTTGKTGAALFDVVPGKYIVVFSNSGENQIQGTKFSDAIKRPAVANIEANSGIINKDITLGRLVIHFADDPKKYDDTACVSARDDQQKLYSIGCFSASKLPNGEQIVIIDLIPSDRYETRLFSNQNIAVTGEHNIGQTPLKEGQITELYCRTVESPGCSIIRPQN